MTIPTYEKIETIVLCRMQNSKSFGGTYGTIIEYKPRHFKVLTDGRVFFVRSTQYGWGIREMGSHLESIDPNILEAARSVIVH